jgi:hypothetical protein
MEWCALSNSAVGTGASQQRGLVSVLKAVAILVVFEAAGSPWDGTKHRVVAVPRETHKYQNIEGRHKRWIQTDDASVRVREVGRHKRWIQTDDASARERIPIRGMVLVGMPI